MIPLIAAPQLYHPTYNLCRDRPAFVELLDQQTKFPGDRICRHDLRAALYVRQRIGSHQLITSLFLGWHVNGDFPHGSPGTTIVSSSHWIGYCGTKEPGPPRALNILMAFVTFCPSTFSSPKVCPPYLA